MNKQKRVKKNRKEEAVRYDTDRLARGVFTSLAADFRSNLSCPTFCGRLSRLLEEGDIKGFRAYSMLSHEGMDPFVFKIYYQMDSIFKKYRFATDAFTDVELECISKSDYLDAQQDFAKPKFRKLRTKMVLQRARSIAREILGEFPEEGDFILGGKIGTKSTIGCPLALASLDFKLSTERAFTSTRESIAWFLEHVLPNDPLLMRIVSSFLNIDAGETGQSVESLVLKCVPKSWKTHRVITPLTLIALFYSYAYGMVVEDRLADSGLDIRTRQEKHAKWVYGASKKRKSATVDLKRASDSVLLEHLMYVLPRKWFTRLKPCLSRKVRFEGVSAEMYTHSVLPMGNAATFPLETLVYYCIIKATGDMLGIRGLYSVYGDDLIYPRKLHPYIVALFPDLGFTLNLDKTFVTSHFRESCGSDRYHGVDVRPFFFPGEHSYLTKTKYVAFLHKVINGLLRRWSPEVIPVTIRGLLIELNKFGPIMRVPPLYPDESGIKVDDPNDTLLDLWYLDWSEVVTKRSRKLQCRVFFFTAMKATLNKRHVKVIEPYLWEQLRSSSVRCRVEHPTHLDKKLDELEQRRLWRSIRRVPHGTRRCSPVYVRFSAPYAPVHEPFAGSALTWKRFVLKKVYFKGSKKHTKQKIVSHAFATDGDIATFNRVSTKVYSAWAEAKTGWPEITWSAGGVPRVNA